MPLTRSTTAFDRIYVDYAIPGAARITWEMRDTLIDPLPWEFQLQVSRDGGGDAWVDVGTSVQNTFYAIDDTQRQYGKSLRIGYRVVLTTPLGTYTSNIAQVLGKLHKRQWLQARAISRRLLLESRGLTCLRGYLMKRKLHGTVCTDCVDPITGGITNSDCSACKGTGIIDGYWVAVENNMIDIQTEGNNEKRSERGTVNDVALVGSFVAPPMLHRNDVWIDKHSDRRYVVNSVTSTAEIDRVPILVKAELRLAEFGDVIYAIDPTEGS